MRIRWQITFSKIEFYTVNCKEKILGRRLYLSSLKVVGMSKKTHEMRDTANKLDIMLKRFLRVSNIRW